MTDGRREKRQKGRNVTVGGVGCQTEKKPGKTTGIHFCIVAVTLRMTKKIHVMAEEIKTVSYTHLTLPTKRIV